MPYRYHGTRAQVVYAVLGVLWLWYCMAAGYRDAYSNILGMQQLRQGYGGVFVKRGDGSFEYVGSNVMRWGDPKRW